MAANQFMPRFLARWLGYDGGQFGFTAWAHYKCEAAYYDQREGTLGEKKERVI